MRVRLTVQLQPNEFTHAGRSLLLKSFNESSLSNGVAITIAHSAIACAQEVGCELKSGARVERDTRFGVMMNLGAYQWCLGNFARLLQAAGHCSAPAHHSLTGSNDAQDAGTFQLSKQTPSQIAMTTSHNTW